MNDKRAGGSKGDGAARKPGSTTQISAEEALAHTRQLLAEKTARDRLGPSHPQGKDPSGHSGPHEAQVKQQEISPEALHGDGKVASGRQDQVKSGAKQD